MGRDRVAIFKRGVGFTEKVPFEQLHKGKERVGTADIRRKSMPEEVLTSARALRQEHSRGWSGVRRKGVGGSSERWVVRRVSKCV